MCHKKVQARHRAIQCDLCDNWVHLKCNFLDHNTYQKLKQDDEYWYCIKCNKLLIPFSNLTDVQLLSLLQDKALHSLPNNLYESNNNELLEKINSLTEHITLENENNNCKYYQVNDLNNSFRGQNYLATLHLNVQSLNAHIDDINLLLALCNKTTFNYIRKTKKNSWK